MGHSFLTIRASSHRVGIVVADERKGIADSAAFPTRHLLAELTHVPQEVERSVVKA
jgi:hypothetical protein